MLKNRGVTFGGACRPSARTPAVETCPSGAQPQATTNLSTANPAFADRAWYDYHLTSQSPGINAGTAPGSANGANLTPVRQYVDPAGREPRPVNGSLDIGAFEYAP